jgi:hypothetical protein
MIEACKEFIKGKLAAAGIDKVYEKESDAAAHKGARYAWLMAVEQQELAYDGGKVAYTDDLAAGTRTYHIRKYAEKINVVLRFADSAAEAAIARRDNFLRLLGTGFEGPGGYRVDVEANAGSYLKDPSILSTGQGADVTLLFTGGVYATRTVRLLTSVEPEGKILTGGY